MLADNPRDKHGRHDKLSGARVKSEVPELARRYQEYFDVRSEPLR